MKHLLRWIGIAVASLVGLCVVAYAGVYALSERTLRRTYEVPTVALNVPTDPDSIREGRRLATIRGCFHDCHGKEAGGQVLFDEPMIARIVAPNLTAAVRQYTDTQLAVIVRNGVRPDGRSLVVMPSEAFTVMTDTDLGRIINEAEFGRHLARTICAECHGTSLRGAVNPDFTSPDLRVAAAYSPGAFAQLLRTGVAIGGRNVGVMSTQARNNLSQLTDSEITALYSYLRSMPETTHN